MGFDERNVMYVIDKCGIKGKQPPYLEDILLKLGASDNGCRFKILNILEKLECLGLVEKISLSGKRIGYTPTHKWYGMLNHYQ